MSFYSEILNDSDDDHTGLYNEDLFVSKGKSKKLPDLMRTCKTKKCGCGKGAKCLSRYSFNITKLSVRIDRRKTPALCRCQSLSM